MLESTSFIVSNKQNILKDTSVQKMLAEVEAVKHFLDCLSTLVFGRDMKLISTPSGLAPVYINHILLSAVQTLQSIVACTEYGNFADAHMLLRKYRDDLFFYLYVVVSCSNNDILGDTPSRSENYINDWRHNELSNLNIAEIFQYVGKSNNCKDAIRLFSLQSAFSTISQNLNNYTHGNGTDYYNRTHTQFRVDEIKQITNELTYYAKYITLVFTFLLILTSPHMVMADDYVDILDMGMIPEQDSQYWVPSFISTFIKNNENLLDSKCIEYLRVNTGMDI